MEKHINTAAQTNVSGDLVTFMCLRVVNATDMFSCHRLFPSFLGNVNKFTDDGKRKLRAAAEKRKSNPDFVKLKLYYH